MGKYLDGNGLSHLCGIVKAYVDSVVQAAGAITGIKGDAESTYRTGNVNLTPANIGAVAVSGGTMTGDLELDDCDIDVDGGYAMLWHPEIIRGTPPSSNIYGGGGALKLVDKNGVQIGYLQPVNYTDGTEAIQLGVGNSDSTEWNTLTIGYDGNDDKYVQVGGQAAWRNAIGVGNLGDTVQNHISSNVSVPDSTYKSIGSISLDSAGTYVVCAGALFASNSTGRRYIALGTADEQPSTAWERATGVQVGAVNGAMTRLHTSWVVSGQTAIHLICWQNSGAARGCQGYIRAVRIA